MQPFIILFNFQDRVAANRLGNLVTITQVVLGLRVQMFINQTIDVMDELG